VEMKNNSGDTAYDLALKNGQESIVKTLSSHVAHSSLDKLTKPRPARSLRQV